MDLWKLWIILAVALFAMEIFVPGFFTACVGIAFLVTAVPAFFDWDIKGQIVVFSVANLILFFGLRPFFLKYLSPSKNETKTNVDALIGQTGFVSEAIDANNSQGRVKVGGDDWRALSSRGENIAVGQRVVVLKVDGTKIIVEPKG